MGQRIGIQLGLQRCHEFEMLESIVVWDITR